MWPRPPRSTPPDTLLPLTTLFRSWRGTGGVARAAEGLRDTGRSEDERRVAAAPFLSLVGPVTAAAYIAHGLARAARVSGALPGRQLRLATYFGDAILSGADGFAEAVTSAPALLDRSEERRVGKECVSTCRSRWSPYH